MNQENFKRLKSLEGKFLTHSNSHAGRWLHYKLISVEPGQIEASVLVRDEMTNPSKNLHGGMIGMIADEICGLCFYSLGHETFYTTVSLNINYLFSVPAGETVIIKARVIRSGKRMANVECSLYDTEDRIVAHATTNLMNSGTKIFELTIGNS
jgi:uncharacterized protein (TIGR00369 family)